MDPAISPELIRQSSFPSTAPAPEGRRDEEKIGNDHHSSYIGLFVMTDIVASDQMAIRGFPLFWSAESQAWMQVGMLANGSLDSSTPCRTSLGNYRHGGRWAPTLGKDLGSHLTRQIGAAYPWHDGARAMPVPDGNLPSCLT